MEIFCVWKLRRMGQCREHFGEIPPSPLVGAWLFPASPVGGGWSSVLYVWRYRVLRDHLAPNAERAAHLGAVHVAAGILSISPVTSDPLSFLIATRVPHPPSAVVLFDDGGGTSLVYDVNHTSARVENHGDEDKDQNDFDIAHEKTPAKVKALFSPKQPA